MVFGLIVFSAFAFFWRRRILDAFMAICGLPTLSFLPVREGVHACCFGGSGCFLR